jgi:hypothetical protein
MSRHHALLSQKAQLELHEVGELRDWLAELRDDCALFGETPEDTALMRRIEAKIADYQQFSDKGE